jgi:hypothetical protein
MPNIHVVVILVSGALTIIANLPGALFIAAIMLVVPALILIAAPNVLVVSTVTLVGRALLEPYGKLLAWGTPLGILAAISIVMPQIWNRPFHNEVAELTSQDRTWDGFSAPVKNLAIIVPPPPWTPAPASNCSEFCQRLLYNGSVDSVLAGPVSWIAMTPPFNGTERLVRFRIERRQTCPAINLPEAGTWPGENFKGQFSYGTVVSDRVKARIAAGECLIEEPAELSTADAIVVHGEVKRGVDAFIFDKPWKPYADTITARRLSAFVRDDDRRFAEVFRQTEIEAKPVFMPLLVGPYDRCGDGVCYTHLGIARSKYHTGQLDLRTFFKTQSNLNVAAVDMIDLKSVVTMVWEALANKDLNPDSPNLKLADQYLKLLGEGQRTGEGDVELVKRIILDHRVTDLFYLSAAVQKLGADAAPLGKPLMQRILGGPLKRGERSPYASTVRMLPPGAAMPIMSDLRTLADDEQRRSGAAQALIRLSDDPAGGGPLLMRLLDIGTKTVRSDPRGQDLMVASLVGLCHLGKDGAAVAPALLEYVRGGTEKLSSLGPFWSLAVAALARMDRQADVDALFADRPELARQAGRRIGQLAYARSVERACYY